MNTPYFLINKSVFDGSVDKLNKAIKRFWPNTYVGYSVKSNAMPWVLQYMKTQGFYAEVVSADEYLLAKSCGFEPSRIIYNGIAKDEATFKEAVNNGAIVNIDSWREIRWLSEMDDINVKKIGLRVNFDIESIYPGITAGGNDGSRFGISYENGDIVKAIDMIRQIPNVCVVGIHTHNSIPTRSLDAYCIIAKKACQLIQEFKLDLDYVDVGGGFFGGMENRPEYQDYFAIISEVCERVLDKEKTALIVEPGMSILSEAITYVTSVVDVKKTNRSVFVVTDGGRTHIDPMMRKQSHFYEIELSDCGRKTIPCQVVCGFSCVEGDRFFKLTDYPELKEGDIIKYKKIGAYTYCSASNFIKFLPEIYLEDHNEIRLVQKGWEAEDFVSKMVSL